MRREGEVKLGMEGPGGGNEFDNEGGNSIESKDHNVNPAVYHIIEFQV